MPQLPGPVDGRELLSGFPRLRFDECHRDRLFACIRSRGGEFALVAVRVKQAAQSVAPGHLGSYEILPVHLTTIIGVAPDRTDAGKRRASNSRLSNRPQAQVLREWIKIPVVV